ncbi:MAG: hypothetical protein KA296_13705 [Marinobacter sp.]|nr:hypothetical protein [Marinobacter sp.]
MPRKKLTDEDIRQIDDHVEDNVRAEALDEAGPNLGGLLKAAQAEDQVNYMDPDQVAENAEMETEEAEAAGIGAEMSASFVVMLAENTALSIWPFLEYDTATRDRTVELLIPVIEKHGGELPPWLAAYKEELMLGGHIALVILMTRSQIKKEDLRLEEEARKQKRAPVHQEAGEEEAADA